MDRPRSRRGWLWLLCCAPLVFVAPNHRADAEADPKADEAVAKAASALYEGIRTETLPNGLKIYLKPVPGSPVITTMVAYKVGSSDENLDQTGLSHYLEHLMFKGTEKIKPGDIDRMTQRNGGANNAYTSEDYTIFHFDFPAEQWEAPLKVEADRMRNLRIDEKHEFQQEKGAVIQELKRDEDQPWDLEQKTILPLLFGKTSPYGHPVIGEEKHVIDATAQIIKSHYDKWYHPNNASLIVVGGFDPDVVLAKIKELFGPIPMAKLPERKSVVENPRKGPVSKEFPSKFDVARLLMCFNTIKTGEPDYYALDVLQSILSSGKTSRLYKKLIEGEEIATQADVSNSTGRYPGYFSFQVQLIQGKDRKKAENLVLSEIKRLRDEPISAAELKRVKQGIIAGYIMGLESVHNLGDSVARGVTTNDLEFLKTYLKKIQGVTAEDVQKAAKKYLDPEQRVVVWSVPEVKKGDLGSPPSSKNGKNARQKADAPKGAASTFSLKDAKRVELPNGLTVLLFENHRLPIVTAQASLKHMRMLEPADKAGVAGLLGRMLDEGTSKHSGEEIAELIENVGGSLSLAAGSGSVKVLSPDRKLGLGLLFECMTDPAFPKEAFARQKAQTLSEIAETESQPDQKASMLYSSSLYGKHPFGRPAYGIAKIIEKLTPEDLKTFHKQVFVPENTVLAIVGDFDSKEVIDEITQLTANWKKGDAPKLVSPEVPFPEKFTEKIVSMPDAAQLHLYMGHPGIKRTNPDYYKLLVMDNVLGVGPGFTDRLSARIRDREGLAYTVRASIAGSAGEEVGLFTCYVGTDPVKFARVKELFLEELNKIRKEQPTKVEVDDAKQYLLGSQAFQATTNDAIAGLLLSIERYKLGFNYLDDYKKAVAAVTPEDVQAMAKKYIDPAKMVLVVVGAVDQNGKPIGKLPPPKQ